MSCLRISSLLTKALPLCSRPALCQATHHVTSVGSQNLPSAILNSLRSFHCTSLKLDVYYSKDHEWVKVDGDVGTIGVSDHAQKELGEVVFCELPEVGSEFEEGDVFGSVESVKAASDMVMPVSGTVVEANEKLADDPSSINSSPENEGWIIKVQLSDASQLASLMTPDAYKEFNE